MVWSPQRSYQQRTVLGFVSTHVSSHGEVLRETVLQVNFVVVNVSDAPQLSARRQILEPVHEPVVSFLVAADQPDVVSGPSEDIGGRLVDINTHTNTWEGGRDERRDPPQADGGKHVDDGSSLLLTLICAFISKTLVALHLISSVVSQRAIQGSSTTFWK